MGMTGNSFGSRFILTSFGESHGPALGAVIEGCPAGVRFDHEFLISELARRRPGFAGASSDIVSARAEMDLPEILSGVLEGKTLGTPIAVLVRNQDARSQDYENLRNQARPGHADDVWSMKYGHRDHRGGGRSSGRETVSRVIGGAVAKMLIRALHPETKIRGFATQIGEHQLSQQEIADHMQSVQSADQYPARYPSFDKEFIRTELLKAKEAGESLGGKAMIVIQSPPKALGQPVFHKLKSDLAAALMSVGGVSAVELGSIAEDLSLPGSKYHSKGPETYGGIRGGISTGETISLAISMKPTSSIMDIAKKGRHDPCLIPRAIPVFEAMMSLVIADHIMWQRTDRLV